MNRLVCSNPVQAFYLASILTKIDKDLPFSSIVAVVET